jgi:hypothetical protein
MKSRSLASLVMTDAEIDGLDLTAYTLLAPEAARALARRVESAVLERLGDGVVCGWTSWHPGAKHNGLVVHEKKESGMAAAARG